MRTFSTPLLLGVSLAASVCLLSGQPVKAAEKASARTVTVKAAPTRSTSVISNEIPVVDIPSSVFVANYSDRSGRDPFFPGADYFRKGETRQRPSINAPLAAPDDAVLKTLKINGSGGVGDKRWVMVNGVTVYLGEHATFQVNGKPVKIQCFEISDKAITVGIKDTATRREIKLQ